jgi:hypothetical protein
MTPGLTSQDRRTPEERLSDRALLLLALHYGEEVGRVGHFLLMKIPFTIQYKFNKQGIKTFSYSFYREGYGPISKAIYDDRDALRDAGLIEGDKKSIRLTKLGDQLAGVVLKYIVTDEQHREVVRSLEDKAQEYAAYGDNWAPIKAEVYALPVDTIFGEITIGEAPIGTDLLRKLEPSTASVRISDELKDTLARAFTLTPKDIEAGCTDSGLSIEEVFAQPYIAT